MILGSLALLVGVNMIDLLPNASLTPWTWLLAGALLGRSEELRAAVYRTSTGPLTMSDSGELAHGQSQSAFARKARHSAALSLLTARPAILTAFRIDTEQIEEQMRRDQFARASAFAAIFAVVAIFSGETATAAPWQLRVDDGTGLPAVTLGGAPAISGSFMFWGKNWAWAGFRPEFKINGPYEYSLSGVSRSLDLSINAQITRPAPKRLLWNIDFDVATDQPDVVGGGIAFNFNLEQFGSGLGEPELLRDNQGWIWGRNKQTTVELRVRAAATWRRVF